MAMDFEELRKLTLMLALPIDSETRSNINKLFYQLSQGAVHSLLASMDLDEFDSETWIEARNLLEVLEQTIHDGLIKTIALNGK